MRLLRLLGPLPSVVFLREFAELLSRAALRGAESLSVTFIMILTLSQVSVAHGATASEARLDLLTSHEVVGTLMGLVDSLHAGLHSKFIFIHRHLSSSRNTLVLIGLLARETRILWLVIASEGCRSVLGTTCLELRLIFLTVIVHAEVDLRLVLQGSRLMESLVDVNGRSEDGTRSHHVSSLLTNVDTLVMTKTEVAGTTRLMMNLDRCPRIWTSKISLILALLSSNLLLPGGSLVVEVHDMVNLQRIKFNYYFLLSR